VLWQTKKTIPPVYKNHIVSKILSLDLQFLHYNYVGLEDIEHGWKSAAIPPGLIPEWVPDPIDIPRCYSDSIGGAHIVYSF
jgi:hypothetical protein